MDVNLENSMEKKQISITIAGLECVEEKALANYIAAILRDDGMTVNIAGEENYHNWQSFNAMDQLFDNVDQLEVTITTPPTNNSTVEVNQKPMYLEVSFEGSYYVDCEVVGFGPRDNTAIIRLMVDGRSVGEPFVVSKNRVKYFPISEI